MEVPHAWTPVAYRPCIIVQVSCERALLHSALSDVALLHGEGMAAYIQLSGGMAAWVGDSARPASGSG